MSEFVDHMQVCVTATIACRSCGEEEEVVAGTEGEAVRRLGVELERCGWRLSCDAPLCPECAYRADRMAAEALEGRHGAGI